METKNTTPAQRIHNISNTLQSYRAAERDSIVDEIMEKYTAKAQATAHAADIARDDLEDIQKELENLRNKKEELEPRVDRQNIITEIRDCMEDCEATADRAQIEASRLEDDEDLKYSIDQLISQIRDIYENATSEDYEQELDEVREAISDKEDEERVLEDETIPIADEEAKLWDTLVTDLRDKPWQEHIAELATATYGEEEDAYWKETWVKEAVEIIEEILANHPTETPEEAEARMAEEDEQAARAELWAQKAAARAAEVEKAIVELVMNNPYETTPISKQRTLCELWKTAAADRTAAKNKAIGYINEFCLKEQKAAAAEYLIAAEPEIKVNIRPAEYKPAEYSIG